MYSLSLPVRAYWGVGLVLGAGVIARSRTGRAGPTGTPQMGSGVTSLGGMLWMETEGPGAVCAEAKGVVSAKAWGAGPFRDQEEGPFYGEWLTLTGFG